MNERSLQIRDDELAARGYPEVLDTTQACTILGVCRRTLHDLIQAGDLEVFRLRKYLRVERVAVAKFILASRVLTETDTPVVGRKPPARTRSAPHQRKPASEPHRLPPRKRERPERA